MNNPRAGNKVGIYVDSSNLYYNGGFKMQYDVLRDYACRDGSEPVRMNAYVSFDRERSLEDLMYRNKALSFHDALRALGYKVVIKDVIRYKDDEGNTYTKANADIDMVVDMMLQSDYLDRVLLATGDGDFVRLIEALQNKGVRVEVLAFENISNQLRTEADYFTSGYIIPNLLPMANIMERDNWGASGTRVRGWCSRYNPDKGIGSMTFLKQIPHSLYLNDVRNPDFFESAFFHFSELYNTSVQYQLPSSRHIFEFTVVENERGLKAEEIKLLTW
ncbi:MAG TPA: NYN domain-containing protein [Rhodothermales bacterium]|nr:NYN domain-containing protein [Rhodothermales bacterium]